MFTYIFRFSRDNEAMLFTDKVTKYCWSNSAVVQNHKLQKSRASHSFRSNSVNLRGWTSENLRVWTLIRSLKFRVDWYNCLSYQTSDCLPWCLSAFTRTSILVWFWGPSQWGKYKFKYRITTPNVAVVPCCFRAGTWLGHNWRAEKQADRPPSTPGAEQEPGWESSAMAHFCTRQRNHRGGVHEQHLCIYEAPTLCQVLGAQLWKMHLLYIPLGRTACSLEFQKLVPLAVPPCRSCVTLGKLPPVRFLICERSALPSLVKIQ